MSSDFTMLLRYLLMSGFGALVAKGYLDSSLVEPLIGVSLAVAGYCWKKYEDRLKLK